MSSCWNLPDGTIGLGGVGEGGGGGRQESRRGEGRQTRTVGVYVNTFVEASTGDFALVSPVHPANHATG